MRTFLLLLCITNTCAIPQDLTKDNFDDIITSAEKEAFINFYIPGCKECIQMEDVWNKIGIEYKGSHDVVIGRMNCLNNEELCQSLGVSKHPSNKYFRPGKTPINYKLDVSFDHLKKFVDDMIHECSPEDLSACQDADVKIIKEMIKFPRKIDSITKKWRREIKEIKSNREAKLATLKKQYDETKQEYQILINERLRKINLGEKVKWHVPSKDHDEL